MKVKVLSSRNILVGFDIHGGKVTGTLGDEFSVPGDLSLQSANRGVKFGFLKEIVEPNEVAKLEKPKKITRLKAVSRKSAKKETAIKD